MAAGVNKKNAYLAIRLARAPGRRVADLDRDAGERVTTLTGLGFEVTVVKPGDPLGAERWPLSEVDAVICIDPLATGSEPEHLRLLRGVRRHLAPRGLLIAGHRNAFRVVGDLLAAGNPEFDLIRGRYRGARCYTVPEMTALLAKAGFAVERVDTDFDRGSADHEETPAAGVHDVQIVGRPVPLPPAALAGMNPAAADDGSTEAAPELNLGWAPDEPSWLHPSPVALWRDLITEQPDLGAGIVRHYPLNDPHGGARAAATVSKHFRTTVKPSSLTFGAGTTALLRCLSGLADAGGVLAPAPVFPDLPAWSSAQGGGAVRMIAAPYGALPSAIRSSAPSLVHLDRPNLTGEHPTAEEIVAIGEAAADVGAVVSIDEAYATYFGPAGSAVPLVRRLDNLIVLRSLSKGYGWGGLRVGFAVASGPVAGLVRELVPPLQVSELAYHMALRLLSAGDVFAPLRARTAAHKPELRDLLRRLDLPLIEGHPLLPWVVIPDQDGSADRTLRKRGVQGKVFPAQLPGDHPPMLRLSVPLSDRRLRAARRLLS
jgi:histidinol-phosphate aminotransferase